MVSIPIAAPGRASSAVSLFPSRSALPLARCGRAGQRRGERSVTSASHAECTGDSSRSRTRIKPPGDIIKLADRLHYVLQPSLESLLAEGSLAFPFRPFPFQFEGVAFLYPRQAAILADEMGLGKTMQAITAIRLLLHRGEVRSVLLVCPKPLVTNWQREFAVWAPEVPVMVVEGDQAKRQLAMVVARRAAAHRQLRIAAARSASLLAEPAISIWSCSTNRSGSRTATSSTSEVVRSISRKRSWALTGTPVENSADDLLGIFEFLAPGFLSPEMKPRSMGRSIRDYVLRRTKDQVLSDLPPKLIHDEPLESDARAARKLPAGRGGGRGAADRIGRRRPRSGTSSSWCCG